MESANTTQIVYNVFLILLIVSSWNLLIQSNQAQSIPTAVKIGKLITMIRINSKHVNRLS